MKDIVKRGIAFIVMIVGLGITLLFAQVSFGQQSTNPGDQPFLQTSPISATTPAEKEELGTRMARLEAENRRMQAELLEMQRQAAQPSVASASPADMTAAGETQPSASDGRVTMPEVQGEVKKMMWSKGDFQVVPYGILWGNSVYSTQRTYPGSYTLFVDSRSQQDQSEFIVDARNTRLGIDVLGPRVPMLDCAQSGGKVEIDFQGACAGTENKGSLLLRHAYVEVKDDDFRLLAGQTWDVISPLNPNMLLYSVLWGAGNIGYRRAQFRAERFLDLSDTELLTVQSSINQNVLPDEIANLVEKPSSWPIIEGRIALTIGDRKCPDALPMTFGVSSHVGQTECNCSNSTLDNVRRDTWSLNADIYVPITHRFGFQGEFFTGQDLSPFLGGIVQGIDPTTFNPIHSTGGWGELWYDWTPCLHSRVGYSLDNPAADDLNTAGERSYNQVFYGNVTCDLTKQFLVGLEVSSWKTLYVGLEPGDAVRCEFVVKYGF